MNKLSYLFLLLAFLSTGIACKKSRLEPEQIRELISHRTLGLGYLEEGQYDEASREFRNIIRIAPNEALGYANLALSELRKGNDSEAEAQAKKAIERSNDSDVRLILAEIQEKSGHPAEAIGTLQTSIQKDPGHAKTQFKISRMLLNQSSPERWKNAEIHIAKVIDLLPANLTARLIFTEVLLHNGKSGQAAGQLETIRQQISSIPEDAVLFFNSALDSSRNNRSKDALVPLIAFHNILKPTPLYRDSIQELTGPGGAIIGFPILNFSSTIPAQLTDRERMQTIRFVDVTETSGIRTGTDLAFADLDRDGDLDVFVSGSNLLLQNEKGRFRDITTSAGIHVPPSCRKTIFGDFNNDLKNDLVFLCDSSIRIYQNEGNTTFRDVTTQLGFSATPSFQNGLLVDLDMEGDLDLFLSGSSGSRSYRNSDGSFIDVTDAMKLGAPGTDTAFGDFDEDGDLDLILAGDHSNVVLYDNLRQGQYHNIAARADLGNAGNYHGVAVADYDNDGFLDLYFAGDHSSLHHNRGNGIFEQNNFIPDINAKSATFCDFDNDGRQDLLVASTKSLRLFRNSGNNRWDEVSNLLPPIVAERVYAADYDNDGDQDIFTTGKRVNVLRNDGGNLLRWLKVKLQGLGTGSGKNNVYGIGAKLEVRAGDLYQMQVVRDDITHFGLGSHQKADAVRIVWTNGVPQNHFQPATNQMIVEKQVLKGSCAFLYAWNGERFEFVTDVMWKSALGMPLGIMGGTTAYAFSNSTDEYLRIPGEALKPKDGNYTFQVTEELWETSYMDQLRLVAVDHPSQADIFINEQFVPPPYPPLRFYSVSQKHLLVSATDEMGNDLLLNLKAQDELYVSHMTPGKYQGIMEPHDLILNLGNIPSSSKVVLFLNGWLFPSDASINVAFSQSQQTKSPPRPVLEVAGRNGQWMEIIPGLSFPMGKNKTAIVDLTGQLPSGEIRLRIRTNLQIYWNHIFFTLNETAPKIVTTRINPDSTDLHYRGFSQLYRKSPYSPHLFDYSQVQKSPIWRDLEGNYTRYGDVTPLLAQSDDEYVIMNAGDEMTVRFRMDKMPDLPDGWKRDFLIYTDGWIKDGDLNTAYSKTVEPLPFHAMPSYPYGNAVSYPADKHSAFLKNYNTRRITAKPFHKSTSTQ